MPAPTYSITIKNTPEQPKESTYAIYQLVAWEVLDDGSINSTNLQFNEQITALKENDEDVWSEEIFKKLTGTESINTTLIKDKWWTTTAAAQSDATAIAKAIQSYNEDEETDIAVYDKAVYASGKFSELEPGYYLIVETGTKGEVIATVPILVPVTNENMEVYPKSSQPDVTKVIEKDIDSSGQKEDYGKSTEDIGDTVHYRLDVAIPIYTDGENVTFKVTDIASKGLTVKEDTVTVYKVSADGNREERLHEDNYSVTKLDASANLDGINPEKSNEYEGGTELVVDFKGHWSAIQDAAYISIRYDAELNADCVVAGDGNPNKVKLTYSNNYNSTFDTEWREVRTYTYDFAIKKVGKASPDAEELTETPLGGAKFAVIKVKEDPEHPGQPLKKDDGSYEFIESMKYIPQGASKVAVTETTEVDGQMYYLFESEEGTGKITVTGLDEGLYVIKEIEAPSGYALAEDTVFKITAKPEGNSAHEIINVKDNSNQQPDGTVDKTAEEIKIIDIQGVNLPTTGGIGTTIFYVLGALLVVIAGVVLVTRRRMNGK